MRIDVTIIVSGQKHITVMPLIRTCLPVGEIFSGRNSLANVPLNIHDTVTEFACGPHIGVPEMKAGENTWVSLVKKSRKPCGPKKLPPHKGDER
jgi:hypothetical protein